ncbi:hypothetical protein BC940DRAFT_294563 [Gongronella butleri]|nr:hypothetical protein BC940DRAFT_294563 [Gongronella butleri]
MPRDEPEREGVYSRRRTPLTPTNINGSARQARNKGKGVARREVIVIESPEPTDTLLPISPYERGRIQRYASSPVAQVAYTPYSPEYTGPQAPLSPSPPPEILPPELTLTAPVTNAKQFYAAIPLSLHPVQRMKQLLLWCIDRVTRQRYSTIYIADDDDHDPAATISVNAEKLQKAILSRLFNDGIDTSWSRRSGTPRLSIMTPNPKNEQNRVKLQKYKQLQALLRQEDEQWKQVESHVYEKHALAMDEHPDDEEPLEVDCDDYLEHLDAEQRAFLEKIAARRQPGLTLRQRLLRTSRDVTKLLQDLNVAHQRKLAAQQRMAHLREVWAHQLRSRTLLTLEPAAPPPPSTHDTTSSASDADALHMPLKRTDAHLSSSALPLKRRKLIRTTPDPTTEYRANHAFMKLLANINQ